jgi:hypothetical protein
VYAATQRPPAAARGRPAPPAFPPAAPLTPAQVPRGVAVSDPPGTWSHPSWQALHFALNVEHRFAYQWLSAGSGPQATFTARAVGDLDGDGQTVTYELSGHLDARLELVMDAAPRRVGPED